MFRAGSALRTAYQQGSVTRISLESVGIMAYRDVSQDVTNKLLASYIYAEFLKNIQPAYRNQCRFVQPNPSINPADLHRLQMNRCGGSLGSGLQTSYCEKSTSLIWTQACCCVSGIASMTTHPVHNSLGFAVHHLTRPDESFENISTRFTMRFTATYGCMFPRLQRQKQTQ
ncbi:MAG: hypothetical protein U0T77_01280 [Chitinophagales bacterium]